MVTYFAKQKVLCTLLLCILYSLSTRSVAHAVVEIIITGTSGAAACSPSTVTTGWLSPTIAVCQQLDLSWLTEAANVLTNTSSHRVSNKQNNPREILLTVDGSNEVAINADLGDQYYLDSIAANIKFLNPTGTGGNPVQGQDITITLFSTTPRNIEWDTQYAGIACCPLPASTTGDGETEDVFKFRRNNRTSKWVLLASSKDTGTETAYIDLLMKDVNTDVTQEPESIIIGYASPVLMFDAASVECGVWVIAVPGDYKGSPIVRMWYATPFDTNTSHTASFAVQIDALKISDPANVSSFDTANICTDPNIPGTAWHWNDLACPIVFTDTLAINEIINIAICTEPSVGTWAGDLALIRARFEYAR